MVREIGKADASHAWCASLMIHHSHYKGPGGKLHAHPIYRAPFISYAPLTFVTPMLGAALGAYEIFRDWTKSRRGTGGVAIAEQVRLGRAAAISMLPNCCCAARLIRRKHRLRHLWPCARGRW